MRLHLNTFKNTSNTFESVLYIYFALSKKAFFGDKYDQIKELQNGIGIS